MSRLLQQPRAWRSQEEQSSTGTSRRRPVGNPRSCPLAGSCKCDGGGGGCKYGGQSRGEDSSRSRAPSWARLVTFYRMRREGQVPQGRTSSTLHPMANDSNLSLRLRDTSLMSSRWQWLRRRPRGRGTAGGKRGRGIVAAADKPATKGSDGPCARRRSTCSSRCVGAA